MIEFTTENLLYIVPIASIIALLVGVYFFKDIWSKDKGTPEMQKISDKIEEGAMAYLRQQYKTIGLIAVIIAVIIAIVGFVAGDGDIADYLNWKVAIAFIIGAGFSILSGFIGKSQSTPTSGPALQQPDPSKRRSGAPSAEAQSPE